MSYPIQQGLWESLDAVLFNKALALAKDIAVDLNVSAQALIDVLKVEERGKFTIIPDEDAMYQCNLLIKKGPAYIRCRCPTLTQRCCEHTMLDQPVVQLPIVQRMVTPDSIYLIKNDEVYTKNGAQCGILNGSVLTLFEVESD